MTPDEARTLSGKLDDVLVVVGAIQVDIAVVKANQASHDMQHNEYQRTRHDTCPNAGSVRDLVSDVNGIAGIQRTHHADLANVKKWIEDHDAAMKLEAAKDKIKMTPILWARTNVDKVFWLVIGALVLWKLGL